METVKYIIGDEFVPEVIQHINNAQSNIDIVVFDWRHYPNTPNSKTSIFNQAIASACKRGVQVRAVVNSQEIKTFLDSIGAQTHIVNSKHLVHAKIILIDDTTTVIGSHNFTSQAFAVNFETSAIIENTQAQQRLREFFNTLWLL